MKKFKLFCAIPVLLTLVVLACSTGLQASKVVISSEEMTRLVKAVNTATGSKFLRIPQVEVRCKNEVRELLRSDEEFFQGILQKKGYTNFELRTSEDIDLVGRYSFVTKKVVLAEDLLQQLATSSGLPVEMLTKLVLIHELIHAQDDQHYNLHILMRESTNTESWFALSAVYEGHAYQAALNAYEAAGIGKKPVEQYTNLLLRPRCFNPYWALYVRGMDFLNYVTRNGRLTLKQIFARPPIYGEQIMNPARYLDGTVRQPAKLQKALAGMNQELPWYFLREESAVIDPLTYLVNCYVENGENDLVDHFRTGLALRFVEKVEKKSTRQSNYSDPTQDGKKGALSIDIYEIGTADDLARLYKYCVTRSELLNGKGSDRDFNKVKKKFSGTYFNFKTLENFGEVFCCVAIIKARYVVQICESNLQMSENDLLKILEEIQSRL